MHRSNHTPRAPRPAIGRRLRERLVYLPGAGILLYGFWLTLTAGAPAA